VWKKLEPEHKKLANAGFVLSGALILLARSVTSLVILILAVCVLSYGRWISRTKVFWAAMATASLLIPGILSVLWATTNLEAVSGGLGRDPLLTGRVPLWIMSVAAARLRPWFGYGYDAFWLPDGIFTKRIWHVLGWMPPHAHNGFIELWLELGTLGAGLFLVVFTYYAMRSVSFLLKRSSDPMSIWPIVFMAFMLFSNLTEVSFLSSNSIFFILYASTACLITEKTASRQSAMVHSVLLPRHG
jgi:O-antigen ligase